MGCAMCISYTLEITQLQILHFYVKMNHFEAYLRVSSGVVDSKVLRIHGHSVSVFFLIRRQNGKCNVRNFRRFLFGMSPDVLAFKVCAFYK